MEEIQNYQHQFEKQNDEIESLKEQTLSFEVENNAAQHQCKEHLKNQYEGQSIYLNCSFIIF